MANFNKATCFSHTKKDYCDFKWVISDYMLVFARQDRLESPVISVGRDNTHQFELRLSCTYKNYGTCRRLILFVLRKPEEKSSVKFNLSVIKDGKIVDTRIDYANCSPSLIPILEIPTDEMKKFVSSTDTLIFHIELTVSTGDVIYSINKESIKTDFTPKLKFDWVFNNRKFCDAVLNTSGSNIPAHRLMLATASPVFRALFSQDDTFLNKIEIVNMKDVSYETAEEMLRFIYTGTIESHEITLIIDLLVTAVKYQLEELKNECERILSSLLSPENAVDIINVADKCNMISLKKNAADFLKYNISVTSNSNCLGNMILSMGRLHSK
ncbi:protein maternal effect lethal 26-like [Trichogramma pretiosum]|uniref:protein maternal effect lethal 26-like n=1 Tax=Trichogramma pretiosum TaxID=7493 RepID=UPI000C71952D|nr:protein maternal effect lethal 26-like [Trichogramma pretiosum]